VFLLWSFFTAAGILCAQTNLLELDYQMADTVMGPWTKPSARQAYVQPNGAVLTLTSNAQQFFRLTQDHALWANVRHGGKRKGRVARQRGR
jgi:hypothetical protein